MKKYPDEIVYIIKNVITGRSYIGVTEDLEARIRNHFCLLNKNKHTSKTMLQDFIEYGRNSFVYGEVKRFPWYAYENTARKHEKELIRNIPKCYNIQGNPMHKQLQSA